MSLEISGDIKTNVPQNFKGHLWMAPEKRDSNRKKGTANRKKGTVPGTPKSPGNPRQCLLCGRSSRARAKKTRKTGLKNMRARERQSPVLWTTGAPSIAPLRGASRAPNGGACGPPAPRGPAAPRPLRGGSPRWLLSRFPRARRLAGLTPELPQLPDCPPVIHLGGVGAICGPQSLEIGNDSPTPHLSPFTRP